MANTYRILKENLEYDNKKYNTKDLEICVNNWIKKGGVVEVLKKSDVEKEIESFEKNDLHLWVNTKRGSKIYYRFHITEKKWQDFKNKLLGSEVK